MPIAHCHGMDNNIDLEGYNTATTNYYYYYGCLDTQLNV